MPESENWVPITRGMLLAVILIIAAACGSPGKSHPESWTQTQGQLTANLQVAPYPPAPMQDATLMLGLEGNGIPVSGATTTFDITMLDCTMAPDHPVAIEEKPGVYRARTLFTMAGAYRIEATVTLPAESHVFTFYLASK